ncbi:MAG TPA: RNA polymerase sigma factor [Acidimicrobiales bacterium]
MANAYRSEWAYVLAATIRVTGDIDVAEECVQESFSSALATWTSTGIPERTGAWLTTVARRKAIDVLRRQSTQDRVLRKLMVPSEGDLASDADLPLIDDDRLRLIFTCCHPALSIESQVALTLKLLCGLTTLEIGRAFLVSETAMAARLTRAKKKITATHIPYRVPTAEELPARVDSVLSVIQLVFTTGHTAPSGSDLVRRDLVERSVELIRMLRVLLPGNGDVAGLLALVTLTDARRVTRTDAEGTMLLLSEQDRSQWDHEAIAEGVELVSEARRTRPVGRFVLMAGIAAVHAEAPSWEETEWREITALYDLLLDEWPSPVVALNRAVAIGFSEGPEAGLNALDALVDEPYLTGYNYFASARADFLRRLSRVDEARDAYEEALGLTENQVERSFLERRLEELSNSKQFNA